MKLGIEMGEVLETENETRTRHGRLGMRQGSRHVKMGMMLGT